MDAVISRISGGDQIQRGHMQTGRTGCVGEFQRHNDELLAFAVDDIGFEFVGNNQPFGKLVRETGLPKLCDVFRRYLFLHYFYRTWGSHEARLWETLQKDAGAKEVIAMSMRCIDSCEILSRARDPIGLSPGLLLSDERIDHYGVSRTVYQSR